MALDAPMIDDLKARWETSGIHVESGPGGLPAVRLSNDHGEVRVTLHGAHVLSYEPHGQKPILWLSQAALFQEGKAIRGGIPICWPWFANHPNDASKPAHGFARTSLWEVTAARSDGESRRLQLRLQDSEDSRALWPHAFVLSYEVMLEASLQVRLTVHNPSDEPFTYTGALHTYFGVSHISQASVEGLDGASYIDSLDDCQRKHQSGPITFAEEVDRIYTETKATCEVVDRTWQRRVVISKEGSQSTVVWNPWIAKSQRMGDFGDEEYQEMLCVETANAGPDKITVPPGGTHVLGVEMRLG